MTSADYESDIDAADASARRDGWPTSADREAAQTAVYEQYRAWGIESVADRYALNLDEDHEIVLERAIEEAAHRLARRNSWMR